MALAEVVLDLGGESFLGGQAERGRARLMRSPRVPWWPGSVQTQGGLHIGHERRYRRFQDRLAGAPSRPEP